jgi:hypothetical protein
MRPRYTVVLLIAALSAAVLAQRPPGPNAIPIPPPAQGSAPPPHVSVSRDRNLTPERAKLSRSQRQLLEPADAERNRASDVLALPGSSIFKLLPDVGCEPNVFMVRADEECQTAIPGASYWSFRISEHSNEALADLRLKDGMLISDGVLTHGLITEIGDVPLAPVSLASPALAALQTFRPAADATEAQAISLELNSGIKKNGYEFRKFAAVRVNETYAMRVIAYRGKVLRSFDGVVYDLLGADKRADILVAFRVVRQDKDGSVTIVSHELARTSAPKIKVTSVEK